MRLAPLLLALGLASCLHVGGEPAPNVDHVHALEPRALPAPRAASRALLCVHPFTALGRYDVQVIRREPDGRLAVLESERWAERPEDAATSAIHAALARSGAFAGVVRAADGLDAALGLLGTVEEFDVVPAAKGAPRAAFRVRLDIADEKTGKLVRTGTFEGSADLAGADLVGLGPAMSDAVAKALAAALADWSKSGALPR